MIRLPLKCFGITDEEELRQNGLRLVLNVNSLPSIIKPMRCIPVHWITTICKEIVVKELEEFYSIVTQ